MTLFKIPSPLHAFQLALVVDTGGMLGLLLAVVVLGVIVWAIQTYVPLPQPFRIVVWIIAIFALILILCRAFGVWIV